MSNDTNKMTWAELHETIRCHEGDLAPGSETALYGHYVARMGEVAPADWRESDEIALAEEVAWWLAAYEGHDPNTETVDDVVCRVG